MTTEGTIWKQYGMWSLSLKEQGARKVCMIDGNLNSNQAPGAVFLK